MKVYNNVPISFTSFHDSASKAGDNLYRAVAISMKYAKTKYGEDFNFISYQSEHPYVFEDLILKNKLNPSALQIIDVHYNDNTSSEIGRISLQKTNLEIKSPDEISEEINSLIDNDLPPD